RDSGNGPQRRSQDMGGALSPLSSQGGAGEVAGDDSSNGSFSGTFPDPRTPVSTALMAGGEKLRRAGFGVRNCKERGDGELKIDYRGHWRAARRQAAGSAPTASVPECAEVAAGRSRGSSGGLGENTRQQRCVPSRNLGQKQNSRWRGTGGL